MSPLGGVRRWGKMVMGSVMGLVVFGIRVMWLTVIVVGIVLGVVMMGFGWKWGCAGGGKGCWVVWALGVVWVLEVGRGHWDG